MTIKVWEYLSNQKVWTVAEKGEECRIDVSIGDSWMNYGDTIKIKTYAGTVRISGNHVHELMKSILRFSSRDMLENWIRFALLTNKADGRRDIDLTTDFYTFDDYMIEDEKENREREIKWNDNYFNRDKETA